MSYGSTLIIHVIQQASGKRGHTCGSNTRPGYTILVPAGVYPEISKSATTTNVYHITPACEGIKPYLEELVWIRGCISGNHPQRKVQPSSKKSSILEIDGRLLMRGRAACFLDRIRAQITRGPTFFNTARGNPCRDRALDPSPNTGLDHRGV